MSAAAVARALALYAEVDGEKFRLSGRAVSCTTQAYLAGTAEGSSTSSSGNGKVISAAMGRRCIQLRDKGPFAVKDFLAVLSELGVVVDPSARCWASLEEQVAKSKQTTTPAVSGTATTATTLAISNVGDHSALALAVRHMPRDVLEQAYMDLKHKQAASWKASERKRKRFTKRLDAMQAKNLQLAEKVHVQKEALDAARILKASVHENASRHAMTREGQLRLAFKTTTAATSGSAVCAILDLPLHKSAVYRAEELLNGACYVLDTQWYSAMYQEFTSYLAREKDSAAKLVAPRRGPISDVLSYEIHSIRGDAGNSSCVREDKAFASWCMSLFSFPQSATEPVVSNSMAHGPGEFFQARLCIPDLAIVPPNNTGLKAKRLWEHILGGLHLQHWDNKANAWSVAKSETGAAEFFHEPMEEHVSQASVLQALRQQQGTTHVSCYNFCTDKGPDMQGAYKLISEAVYDLTFILIFQSFCFAHQTHLIVKRQLKRLGKYFNTLAKLTNLWRCNAVKIFWEFVTVIVARRRLTREEALALAKSIAGRLPPRCLLGRWGAVHANEDHWISIGRELLTLVYKNVFAAHSSRKKQPRSFADADVKEDFQDMMGRWAKEAVVEMQPASHWLTMEIAHIARGPIMHLHYYLQKHSEAAQMRRDTLMADAALDDLDDAQHLTTLQDLVYSKAQVFEDELNALLCDDPMDNQSPWFPIWKYVDLEKTREVQLTLAAVVHETIELATDYHMRFTVLLSTLEFQLMWLIYCDPGRRCHKRSQVCSALLALITSPSPRASGDTCWKIAKLFEVEFRGCVANGGVMDAKLFLFFHRNLRSQEATTQDIEGFHNVIRNLVTKAPAIGWVLLSARFCNQKRAVPLRRDLPGQKAFLALCNDVCAEAVAATAASAPRVRYLRDANPDVVWKRTPPLAIADEPSPPLALPAPPAPAAAPEPAEPPAPEPAAAPHPRGPTAPEPAAPEPAAPESAAGPHPREPTAAPQLSASSGMLWCKSNPCAALILKKLKHKYEKMLSGSLRVFIFETCDAKNVSSPVVRSAWVCSLVFGVQPWLVRGDVVVDDLDKNLLTFAYRKPMEFRPLHLVIADLHDVHMSKTRQANVVFREAAMCYSLGQVKVAKARLLDAQVPLLFNTICTCAGREPTAASAAAGNPRAAQTALGEPPAAPGEPLAAPGEPPAEPGEPQADVDGLTKMFDELDEIQAGLDGDALAGDVHVDDPEIAEALLRQECEHAAAWAKGREPKQTRSDDTSCTMPKHDPAGDIEDPVLVIEALLQHKHRVDIGAEDDDALAVPSRLSPAWIRNDHSHAYTTWSAKVLETFYALRTSKGAQAAEPREREIALLLKTISLDPCRHKVEWFFCDIVAMAADPPRLEGRVIHLDKQNRVIYKPLIYQPPEKRNLMDYTTHLLDGSVTIRVGVTGGQFIKARTHGRGAMPAGMCRVHKYLEFGFSVGDDPEAMVFHTGPCALCARPTLPCPICQLPFHRDCQTILDSLSREIEEDDSSASEDREHPAVAIRPRDARLEREDLKLLRAMVHQDALPSDTFCEWCRALLD